MQSIIILIILQWNRFAFVSKSFCSCDKYQFGRKKIHKNISSTQYHQNIEYISEQKRNVCFFVFLSNCSLCKMCIYCDYWNTHIGRVCLKAVFQIEREIDRESGEKWRQRRKINSCQIQSDEPFFFSRIST